MRLQSFITRSVMATALATIYSGAMLPVKTSSPYVGLLMLVAMFATGNLLVPSIIWDRHGDRFVCFLIGSLTSEAVLLAIWSALGTDPVGHRFARVTVLFLVGWFTWQVGIRIPERKPIPSEVILFFAAGAILLELLAIGAGLTYRSFSGKQIGIAMQLRESSTVFQVSIKQILGLTTVVAVALVVSRFIVDVRSPHQGLWKDLPMMIGMGLVICTPVLALVWLCLELALGWVPKILYLLMIVFVIPVASLITLIAASLLMREPFSYRAFGDLNSFFIGLALTTTLALTWVGSLGFQLVKRTNDPHPWDEWDKWD